MKYGLLIIVFLLGVYVVFFVVPLHLAPVTVVVPMQASVIDGGGIGFDTSTDLLAFGRIGQGASSKRLLTIKSSKDYSQIARYQKRGNLSEWVSLPDTRYELTPHASTEIPVTLNVPLDAPPGNYTGELFIVVTPY